MTLKTKTTWRTVRLGDVATLHRGYDLPVEEMKLGSYPVIFSNGKIERHNAFKLRGPGVITGRSGTLGNTFYVKEDYWPHNTTLFVSDFHGNDPHFIYYLLQSLDFAHLNAGSGVPTLNRNHAHELFVNIPDSEDTQREIAEILAAFDEKIENNNRIIKTLEEMAQAIFKEWFVNYHFPGHEEAEFIASPLGRIPKGWEVRKISDVARLNRGVSYSSKEIDGGEGVPMINLANFLRGGGFKVEGAKTYSGKHSESHTVKPGQILLAMTDITSNREIVGHPARVPESLSGAIISLDVCSLETDEANVEFLYFLMLRKSFAQVMASSATGTNVSHLSKVNVENYEFIQPDPGTLDQFNSIVRPMVSEQDALNTENKRLAATRDLLLPRLMSGALSVN